MDGIMSLRVYEMKALLLVQWHCESLADQAYIGMPVEMVTRRVQSCGDEGAIIYGYKFRPSRFDPLPSG